MSLLLDQAALMDRQRAADLAHNDAAMYDTNQGRIGMGSVNASRIAIGLRPMTEEEAAEPIRLPRWVVALLVAAPPVCVAVYSGAFDALFPRI